MIAVDIIKEIISAFVGAMGFSLLFYLKGKRLWWASLGGAVAWGFYIIIDVLTANLFFCGVVSAIVATAYSEIFARILKTPKTAFIFPAIVPMVPGKGLYYTMSHMISGELEIALTYAIDTFTTAIALAFGIVVVILWVKVFKSLKSKKSIKTEAFNNGKSV